MGWLDMRNGVGGFGGGPNSFSDIARQALNRPPSSLELDYMAARAEQTIEDQAAAGGPVEIWVGLDLGKNQDYSALCVVQRFGRCPAWEFAVRHLKRWPLGTGYPTVIGDTKALVEKLPASLKDAGETGPVHIMLCVDATGVGIGVYDFVVEAKIPCVHWPIMIHGGRETTTDGRGVHHVPKIELVSAVNRALSAGRLHVADLPLAPVLRRELSTFTVKVNPTTGNETYESWRERDHDDIVLSVAMAVHTASRSRRDASVYMP
jgi:hypothetical protein